LPQKKIEFLKKLCYNKKTESSSGRKEGLCNDFDCIGLWRDCWVRRFLGRHPGALFAMVRRLVHSAERTIEQGGKLYAEFVGGRLGALFELFHAPVRRADLWQVVGTTLLFKRFAAGIGSPAVL
jgi:hypothetical protein